MARHSITLTRANEAWLKTQLYKGEYANKDEAINDLVRLARAFNVLHKKLAKSGYDKLVSQSRNRFSRIYPQGPR